MVLENTYNLTRYQYYLPKLSQYFDKKILDSYKNRYNYEINISNIFSNYYNPCKIKDKSIDESLNDIYVILLELGIRKIKEWPLLRQDLLENKMTMKNMELYGIKEEMLIDTPFQKKTNLDLLIGFNENREYLESKNIYDEGCKIERLEKILKIMELIQLYVYSQNDFEYSFGQKIDPKKLSKSYQKYEHSLTKLQEEFRKYVDKKYYNSFIIRSNDEEIIFNDNNPLYFKFLNLLLKNELIISFLSSYEGKVGYKLCVLAYIFRISNIKYHINNIKNFNIDIKINHFDDYYFYQYYPKKDYYYNLTKIPYSEPHNMMDIKQSFLEKIFKESNFYKGRDDLIIIKFYFFDGFRCSLICSNNAEIKEIKNKIYENYPKYKNSLILKYKGEIIDEYNNIKNKNISKYNFKYRAEINIDNDFR